jgi:hypothetical protein
VRYGFRRYRYRRAGERKSAFVQVRSNIPNHLAHVESIVGACDQWAPAPLAPKEVQQAPSAVAEDQVSAPVEMPEMDPAGYEPDEPMVQEIAATGQRIMLDTPQGVQALKDALMIVSARNLSLAGRTGLETWHGADDVPFLESKAFGNIQPMNEDVSNNVLEW